MESRPLVKEILNALPIRSQSILGCVYLCIGENRKSKEILLIVDIRELMRYLDITVFIFLESLKIKKISLSL